VKNRSTVFVRHFIKLSSFHFPSVFRCALQTMRLLSPNDLNSLIPLHHVSHSLTLYSPSSIPTFRSLQSIILCSTPQICWRSSYDSCKSESHFETKLSWSTLFQDCHASLVISAIHCQYISSSVDSVSVNTLSVFHSSGN